MKTAAAAAANTSSTTANNAKGKNAPTAATAAVTVATNNVRLSRRDQEQAPPPPPGKQAKKHLAAAASSQVTSPVATAQLNYNTMTRRRMTSMEPNKVRKNKKNLLSNIGDMTYIWRQITPTSLRCSFCVRLTTPFNLCPIYLELLMLLSLLYCTCTRGLS